MYTERRNFERFGSGEPAFAISPPEFKKKGKIIDIGWGGLGYKYLAPICLDEGPQEIEIAILMSRTEFFLSRIACKLIYDFQVVEDGYTINHGMEYRRRGLHFRDLTVEAIIKAGEKNGQMDVGSKPGFYVLILFFKCYFTGFIMGYT